MLLSVRFSKRPLISPDAACPVCGRPAATVRGNYYLHVWCPGGHYDL